VRYNIKKTGGIDMKGAKNNKKLLIVFMIILIQLFFIVIPAWAATYYYDESNRLITVDYGQGESIIFDYDNNGNMISKRSIYYSWDSWAAAGNSHTAAVKEDGTVWAWGNNSMVNWVTGQRRIDQHRYK